MAEATSTDRWNHTAALLALLANVHRDPRRRRPFTPADFHPTPHRTDPPPPLADLSVLKTVFVERRLPPEFHRCDRSSS